MEKHLFSVSRITQRLLMTLLAVIASIAGFAQDKQVDVNINTNKGNNFWGQPWVWVVGAAVFIIILVAILRSGRRD